MQRARRVAEAEADHRRPANTLEDFSTSALLVRSGGGIAAAPAVKRGASLHGKLFYLFTRRSSRKKLLFSATATQIQRDARAANRLLGAHAEQTLRLKLIVNA